MANSAIPALLPRTANGHQLVLYGDCCTGVPGTVHERNFATVNAALLRLRPRPEFVCFLGDHVMGLTSEVAALRSQWRHFLDVEFDAVRAAVAECWHVASNHSVYDAASAAVWRDVFSELPQNGPPAERGLAYWVRRGTLLLVVMNTSRAERGGGGGVTTDWLESVLDAHADASQKLVVGHHPIHPVNGYAEHPKWRVPPDEGGRFWATLVRHRVLAYACSHVIAFDTQVHDGVLQITSGGAGTEWGPGGAMPHPPEYLHFVQLAVEDRRLALQARDPTGALRDWLAWPPDEAGAWHEVAVPSEGLPLEVPAPSAWACGVGTAHLLAWRFAGWPRAAGGATKILLRAETEDGRCGLTIAVADDMLVVQQRRSLDDAVHTAMWRGPAIGDPARVDLDVAIHTGMGPGGVLWRAPGSDWNSAVSDGAAGFESFPWCSRWHVGAPVAAGRRMTDGGREVLAWRCIPQHFDRLTARMP
jgi:hypothetical protein